MSITPAYVFLKYFYTSLSILLSPRIFYFRGQVSKKMKGEVTVAKSHSSSIFQEYVLKTKCTGLRLCLCKELVKVFYTESNILIINTSHFDFRRISFM